MGEMYFMNIPLFALIFLYVLYPEFFLRARKIENELTSFIEDNARKVGSRFRGFYIIEDKKLNCYLLPRKKIMFTSGLLEHLSSEEIFAIVLHEIGHSKYKHLSFRIPFVFIYVYILILPFSLAYALLSVDLIMFLASLVFLIGWYMVCVNIVSKWLSKKIVAQEFQSDLYVKDNGLGVELAKGLHLILANNTKGRSIPLKLISFMWKFILGPYPTHPPLEERITRLES